MRRVFTSPLFWGAVLIIGGGLFLLDTLGIFNISDLLWLIIAGVAGLLFLAVYALIESTGGR